MPVQAVRSNSLVNLPQLYLYLIQREYVGAATVTRPYLDSKATSMTIKKQESWWARRYIFVNHYVPLKAPYVLSG